MQANCRILGNLFFSNLVCEAAGLAEVFEYYIFYPRLLICEVDIAEFEITINIALITKKSICNTRKKQQKGRKLFEKIHV